MEEEAEKLKEMQSEVEKQMNMSASSVCRFLITANNVVIVCLDIVSVCSVWLSVIHS